MVAHFGIIAYFSQSGCHMGWVKIKPSGDLKFWSMCPLIGFHLGYLLLTHSHIES